MDLAQLADQSRFIHNDLRLKTFPVGVGFVKDTEGLPEKARRPSKAMGNRITICQAMTMARNYGWQMGLASEDVVCVLASLAFGFTGAEDARKEMVDSFFESQYKSSRDMTEMEVGQMCFLDRGEYEALVLSPLHKIGIAPDTVVLYGNPAQVSRMLQAATYDRGGKIEGLFGGKVECPEYLIRPFKTGQPRVVIPGPGDRIFSMTGDDEMIFAFPIDFLPSFVLGLKESGKKAGARYPITYYQNFEPRFPAHYEALAKRLCV